MAGRRRKLSASALTSFCSRIAQGRRIGGAAADQIGCEAQDGSRRGAHLFP